MFVCYFCVIMETKEFYQSLMAVIEYIAAGHSEVTCEKGEELSGEYWPRIYRLFSNEHVGVGISGGDFHITQPQYLSPIYADCGHALEEIGKREADRLLDNRVKESNIKYARRAFWISVGALIVAATSLVWQLIQATA